MGAQMEQNTTGITFEDFAAYLPDYYFSEQQTEFFQDMYQLITTDTDTSNVTCIPARCGIGKSTFIKAFMFSCIADKHFKERQEPIGTIVITDSIKRLEELSSNDTDFKNSEDYWGEMPNNDIAKHFENNVIVLRSDTPFLDQLKSQHYKPIVLLSTQRYFMLGDNIREQLFSFTYKNKPLKRNIMIFDERPYFSETVTITAKNLTDIEYALYDGLSDEVKEKDSTITDYKQSKDRLLGVMDDKEKLSTDSNVIVYWQDKKNPAITKNDKQFFRVINDNIEPLSAKYPQILKDLRCLQDISQNGAVFNSVKKKHGNYERSFQTIIDNRKLFYLNTDRKFFVFDATADIDPRYSVDYVKLIDCKKYNQPLNMTITNVQVTTSKNALCNTTNKSRAATNAITSYLTDKKRHAIGKDANMLIVVYSDLHKRFLKTFRYVAYFGNLKGTNDFMGLTKMGHIGMNRFPNLTYFYMYCGCNMETFERLSKMSEEDSLVFLGEVSKNHNKEYEEIITSIMLQCMLADFEQNLFRLAIRNYDNTKKIHVWTFCNTADDLYSELTGMIEQRYREYGVQFEYEDTPQALLVAKAKERKPPEGKDKTHAQRIIEWVNIQPDGREFKRAELLKELGMSENQFKNSLKKNQTVKGIVENLKVQNKKGYYEIKRE